MRQKQVPQKRCLTKQEHCKEGCYKNMVSQKHLERKLVSEWLLMLQVLLGLVTPGARNVVYRHL